MFKKAIILILLLSFLLPGSSVKAQSELRTLSTTGKAAKNIFTNSKYKPMVAAGNCFSVILKDDGTVWSIGYCDGSLGAGEIYSSASPVQVKGLTDIISVDASRDSALALKKDGTVWGWGGETAKLGTGKPETCLYASKINGIKDVKEIAVGYRLSLFLKKDGTLWYIGEKDNKPMTPTRIKTLSDVVSIESKESWSIALKKDGTVWVWDVNYETGKINKPVKQNITNVKAIAAGANHLLALKKDKTVWGWGMNQAGQLGSTNKDGSDTFVKVEGLKDVIMIGAGYHSSYAVSSNGTYYALGENDSGQFGNNTMESSDKPLKISDLSNVISFDGGHYHTIVLKGNGEVDIMGTVILGGSKFTEKLKPYKVMDLSKKDTSNPDPEIIPNGSLIDWGSIKPLANGLVTGSGKSAGVKALYACRDSKYLYIAAQVTGGIPPKVSFNLEFDQKGDPDYTLMFTIDSRAIVFRYNSKGRTDNGYGVYGDVIEIMVPLSDLGNPENIYINCQYDDDHKKYGINTEILNFYKVPDMKRTSSGALGINADSLLTGNIRLDGLMDDWSGLEYIEADDSKGENGKGKLDLLSLYAASDQKYLYLAVKAGGTAPNIGISFDTNNDGKDDYEANINASGSSVSIEKYNVNGKKVPGVELKYYVRNKVDEIIIPLDIIGDPKQVTFYAWAYERIVSKDYHDELEEPLNLSLVTP